MIYWVCIPRLGLMAVMVAISSYCYTVKRRLAMQVQPAVTLPTLRQISSYTYDMK